VKWALSVSSRTGLPIFIEIGLYMTNIEKKISWHIFLRHGVYASGNRDNFTDIFLDILRTGTVFPEMLRGIPRLNISITVV